MDGMLAPMLVEVSNWSITLGWMSFPKMSLSSPKAGEPLISRREKIRTIDVAFFTLHLTVARGRMRRGPRPHERKRLGPWTRPPATPVRVPVSNSRHRNGLGRGGHIHRKLI